MNCGSELAREGGSTAIPTSCQATNSPPAPADAAATTAHRRTPVSASRARPVPATSRPKPLHQPPRQRRPAESALSHFQQHQITRRRPDAPLRTAFIRIDDRRQTQLPVLLQHVLIDVVQRRQRMLAGHEQSDLGPFLHGRTDQVRRVTVLFFGEGHMRPTPLHQGHQVIAFGDQAFKFQVRITLLESTERRFESVGLIGVGNRHGQFRLDPLGQLAGGHFQSAGGGQDFLGPLQHHVPGRGQARFAAAAVEQHQVQVDFKAGHGGADGRLTAAQFARRGGKRALSRGLDKGLQHFLRGHELSP